jgi:5-methylthioadenosine/S-adenosylhomocysteine deaminase
VNTSGTIVNAVVLPMGSRPEVVRSGYVTVADGVITAIGEGYPAQVEPGWFIDARGSVLMPGLVNAHTHLYQVLMRAIWEDVPLFPWLKKIYGAARVLLPVDFYAGTLLGCLESLKGGVTTVCEHNFLNPHPDCATESVRALRDSGLRAVFARTIMDTGEIVPDCTKERPEQAFKLIEELVGAARGRSPENKADRLSFMTGANTPPINTTPDLLKQIRAFADANSIGISAHVAESVGILDYLAEKHNETGIVKYLQKFNVPGKNTIFAHCVHISGDEIELLRETGTSVSHNPVSNMMLGDGVAPVREMLNAGVNVALGTDGAASNHSQDLFEVMKAASLLQKVHHRDPGVIQPYAVLRMATAGGAGALGLGTVCGTIEAGKRADLILIDMSAPHNQPVNDLFSQLVHCAKNSDVATAIVDGRLLMKNREVLLLDEGEVVHQAQRANRDLTRRLEDYGI